MCSITHYTDLTYMRGTGSCGPMRTILDSVIKSWYTRLNIKFGANRTLNVAGIPIWFKWKVPDPVNRYSPIPTGLWLIEAYLQSLKFVALCVRT